MNREELYSQFEQLVEKMGITLIEDKGDFAGGYCNVKGHPFIVLNKIQPLGQRLRVLAKSFRKLKSKNLYIVPRLRDFIEFTDKPR